MMKGTQDIAKHLTIDEIEITKQIACNTIRYIQNELKKFNLPGDRAALITRLVLKIMDESCDDVCKAYRVNR